MMLGEESEPARTWEQVGNEALRRGMKRIVMMGAHWETLEDAVEVSMNPDPKKLPMGGVRDDRYLPYKLAPDIEGGQEVLERLRAAGINARAAPKFDWIHDTLLAGRHPASDAPVPPDTWALQFRQAVEDAILRNKGPEVRRALSRLMKHPRFRDAHGN
ncbi:uncharacterized protein N7498_009103 [Penicillium cinerascens]|uniref:Uncharacterized protein n=1 Tax=Penicillium cinerascens TaxID=70096 RepID=A0A9W9M604_9EURO|nr:uncharacterized protein N7498_009103 [Penicillium cinerascens]KAJ5190118.1 hypothetical protein N7498_009103 [Penicillium cinerascens]